MPDNTFDALIDEWLGTYAAPSVSLGELLCDRHDLGRVALICEDEGETTALTYGELSELSSRFAGALSERGIGPGDRVGVLLPRSAELLIALLGIWRAGAVEIPLFTAFGPEAVTYRLNRGRARAVVTDTGNRDKLQASTGTPERTIFVVGKSASAQVAGPSDHDFAGAIASAPSVTGESRHSDSPFIVLFTSGTTGGAKGVPVPARALASFHSYMHYALDLRDDDVFWNASDPGWGYGLWYGIVGVLLLGRTMILCKGSFDAAATLEVIRRHSVTNFAASATLFRSLRAHGVPPDFALRKSLRNLSSAGEPLDADLVQWSTTAFGTPIHDHYGQSEVGMILGAPHHPSVQQPQIPGALGPALPGFAVTGLDENGLPVRYGDVGEIAVDVENSQLYWFAGYDRDPANTAERFRHGPRYYLTGDRAHTDISGRYRFAGRADDVITSAGYRIGPFDIESILTSHRDVREAAVIGTPDEMRGDVVTALIVLDHETPSESLIAELQELVRDRLGKHLYPRRVIFTEALPRTPVGKLDRRQMREMWKAGALEDPDPARLAAGGS